jgi:Na+-translocating ferredoxin:NAD+ oxidoreductase RNF subunit RnfB
VALYINIVGGRTVSSDGEVALHIASNLQAVSAIAQGDSSIIANAADGDAVLASASRNLQGALSCFNAHEVVAITDIDDSSAFNSNNVNAVSAAASIDSQGSICSLDGDFICAIAQADGSILSYASKLFFVPVDEKFVKLRAEMPGANCGGCGFAGCDDYANALVADEDLSCSKCPVGGADLAEKLAEIMGKSADAGEKQIAVVQCNSTKDAVKALLTYKDIPTCKAAKSLFGGMNACPFGCMGLGDCVAACDFDAIEVKDGVATVNKDKCVGCRQCMKLGCPAISMKDKKAHIDFTQCVGCDVCTQLCKLNAIEKGER